MNENILGNSELSEETRESEPMAITDYQDDSPDGFEPVVPAVSGGDPLHGSVGEDGLLRVVVVNDESDTTALLSADTSAMGYQVSEYWLNYYRGILQKMGDVDYCIFSTRERVSGTSSSYIQHYYMYVGDDMGEDTILPGTYTCYDAYANNSVYYIEQSEEYLGNVETGKLVYSNIGNYSDIREGVSHYDSWAILFFLGFFAVYSVCHDIFDYVMEHVYRK